MVNRIIREDPSKSRAQQGTPDSKASSGKYQRLRPLADLILGLSFQTPMSTLSNYLTSSLKGLGFVHLNEPSSHSE